MEDRATGAIDTSLPVLNIQNGPEVRVRRTDIGFFRRTGYIYQKTCAPDIYLLSFFAGADFLAGFAGRLLPKEPLNIFPFLVFLSPLPI